jgi:hypothetical protein
MGHLRRVAGVNHTCTLWATKHVYHGELRRQREKRTPKWSSVIHSSVCSIQS